MLLILLMAGHPPHLPRVEKLPNTASDSLTEAKLGAIKWEEILNIQVLECCSPAEACRS